MSTCCLSHDSGIPRGWQKVSELNFPNIRGPEVPSAQPHIAAEIELPSRQLNGSVTTSCPPAVFCPHECKWQSSIGMKMDLAKLSMQITANPSFQSILFDSLLLFLAMTARIFVRYGISSSTTQPNVGRGRKSLMGKKVASFRNSESGALSQWDFSFSLCTAPEFQV